MPIRVPHRCTVAGFDPGLATFGMAAVTWPTRTCHELVSFAAPRSAKRKGEQLAKHEDRRRRYVRLLDRLDMFLDEWRPVVACVEEVSFAQSHNAIAAMCFGHGALYAACAVRGIPMVFASPTTIKTELVPGRKVSTITDRQIHRAVYKLFTGSEHLILDISEGARQHPVDALGAIHALRENAVVVEATTRRPDHAIQSTRP